MEGISSFLNSRERRDFLVDYQSIFNVFNTRYHNQFSFDEIYSFNDKEEINVYVHFPWCERLCGFCSYTSGIRLDQVMYSDSINQIVKACDVFFGKTKKNLQVSSLFFGGGTPTVLAESLLDKYLKGISEKLSFVETPTITIESNLNNLRDPKLKIARQYTNRLSIGVQSLNSVVRKKANMVFEKKEILERLEFAMRYYEDLNVDMIYGLKGQSEKDFIEDILELIKLGIPSITLYKLEIHKNTPYFNEILNENKEDYNYKCATMYREALQLLNSNGYLQGPSGWFVKRSVREKSWEKRVEDWEVNKQYLGIGNGAYSHLKDFFVCMEKDYQKWRSCIEDNINPIEEIRKKGKQEIEIIRFIKKLRSRLEISYDEINNLERSLGAGYAGIVKDYFYSLKTYNLVGEKEEILQFNDNGLSVMNVVVLDLCEEIRRKVEIYGY